MGSLFKPLCFQKLVLAAQLFKLLFKLIFYTLYCNIHFFRRSYIVRRRENAYMVSLAYYFSRNNVYFRYSVYFITEKFNPYGTVAAVDRENFNNIPANPECSSLKIHIISISLRKTSSLSFVIPGRRESIISL